jgi:ubiquinone biosynthesis protein
MLRLLFFFISFRTFLRLLTVMRTGFCCWLSTRCFRSEDRGTKIRQTLIALGPTFVKFGQWASVRPDVVPPDVLKELQALQDEAPPLPFGLPRQLVDEELNKPFEDVFVSFDDDPISAASVAQVHRAVLRDSGEVAAIKIQRPHVAEDFRRDMQALKLLASFLARVTGDSNVISLFELIEVFKNTLEKEIDFTTEARNQERARQIFQKDPHIRVPRVHFEYCTRRLIVMEMFVGLKLRDSERFSEFGLDRRVFTHAISISFFNQFFRYGVYQADPHPGNFIFMANNDIGIVDFGIIGLFDDSTVEILFDWFRAVVGQDVDLLLRTLFKVGTRRAEVNLFELRTDLFDYIMYFHYTTPAMISYWQVGLQFSELLNKHNIYIPPNLLYFNKSLATLEGVGRRLDPSFDWREAWGPLFKQEAENRYTLEKFIEEDFRTLLEYRELYQKLPAQFDEMNRLVHRYTENVDERLKDIRNEMRGMSQKLAFAVLAANLILGGFVVIHRTGFYQLGLSPGAVFFAVSCLTIIVTLLLGGRRKR